jgi:hypothetical protein
MLTIDALEGVGLFRPTENAGEATGCFVISRCGKIETGFTKRSCAGLINDQIEVRFQ